MRRLHAAALRNARFWRSFAEAPPNDRERTILNRLLDGFEGETAVPE